MNIFITGATGFIGKTLVKKWLADHHQITLLSRQPKQAEALFHHAVSAVENLDVFSHFDQFDVVVNLAGEPIFNQRWSAAQKEKLWHSRVNLTEKLTALINQSQTPPQVFLSASATGYYGNGGENSLTENAANSLTFTGQLCAEWERVAAKANTRICLLRTGMPFDVSGGAFAKILPFYRLGLGGKLGNGNQFMPWIALTDLIGAINFLMLNQQAKGAFNLCAPHPIRNSEFNHLLGSALNRPHFAHAPACLLKLLLGERACLLLDSHNAHPEKLLKLGFQFQFNQFEPWLNDRIKKAP